MDAHKFVELVEEHVTNLAIAAAKDLLRSKGPGKDPDPARIELCKWFAALPKGDQAKVDLVVAKAAAYATSMFLATLDNDSKLGTNPDPGALELYYVTPHGRTRLNDPNGPSLSEQLQMP